MTHGPDKRRDIARSVLPSTDRKAARKNLAAIKRNGRRAVRQDLRAIGREERQEAVVDRYDGAPFDPWGYPDGRISWAVRSRRRADKLGPVTRWGRATTRLLPLEDRLGEVRRLLDDTLAGRHAASHLQWDPHFLVRHDHVPPWRGDPTYWRRARRTQPPVDELRDAVAVLLADGRHRELNDRMKAVPRDDGSVRVLAGQHDVDAFVRSVASSRQWREVVLGFRRF